MTIISDATDARGYERVDYAGRPGLVGLLSKTFFLILVTLGIYRFWAATKLRRYLWSNIQIGGDGLEYTGTGRELFLGFLIALAFLAPLSIAYVVVLAAFGAGQSSLSARSRLQLATYFAVLFILLQVALFRSRRYRLSRTLWRGIYAGQDGSTWHYLWLFLAYGVLTAVTLGVALPWMQVALERYKLNHTWFGDHEMSIDAKGSALLPRWLVVIACVLLPIVLAVAPNLAGLLHPVYVELQPGKPILSLPHPGAFTLLFVSVIAGGLTFVWYRIEAFRYLASHIKLGEIRLHSAAKGSTAVGRLLLFGLGMIGIAIGFAVIMYLAGLIAGPIIKAATGGKPIQPQDAVLLVMSIMLPLYVVIIYLMQLTAYCWLWIPIIRHLASTLAIENFAAAQTISQSTQPRQKLGIADSFELGAF